MASKKELETALLWLIKDCVLEHRRKCIASGTGVLTMVFQLDPTETKIARAIDADMLFGVKLLWSPHGAVATD